MCACTLLPTRASEGMIGRVIHAALLAKEACDGQIARGNTAAHSPASEGGRNNRILAQHCPECSHRSADRSTHAKVSGYHVLLLIRCRRHCSKGASVFLFFFSSIFGLNSIKLKNDEGLDGRKTIGWDSSSLQSGLDRSSSLTLHRIAFPRYRDT